MSEGFHRKPQFNIYSTMLIIAFVALLIGTVFAYLETMDYETNKTTGAPPVSMVLPSDWFCGTASHCRQLHQPINTIRLTLLS